MAFKTIDWNKTADTYVITNDLPLTAISQGSLVSSLEEMKVGDFIPCRYTAISGVAGSFSELGTCTTTEIPVTGTATPDGKFYFVKSDKGFLIGDRVIQTNISWNILNNAKYIEGNKLSSNIIMKTSDIPIMTSNTVPSGTVAVSSYHTSFPAYLAFDKSTSTMWSTLSPTTTGWLSYKFIVSKMIKSYKITPFAIPSRAPKTWTFEGSNDGSSWTVLDSQTVTNWVASTSKLFYISNIQAFLYYRINITANNGDSELLQISEFDMFEGVDIGYIRSLSGGNSYLDASGNSSISNSSLGAWPSSNEWDTYIAKGDLEGKIIAGDNNVWHCNNNIRSWMQETPIISLYASSLRIMRGFSTPYDFGATVSSNIAGAYGFRPVLQYIE